MHIRDGILGPEVCLVAGAISLGAIGYSLRRLRLDLEDRAVPLTGMLAALVFAGQMVNFPLLGLPVSGHLLGGVLAAVMLGPWAGCLAIAMVLIVQALLFSDGGLLSLGANILNMGVVGAWGGYAVYATVRRLLGNGAAATVSAAVISAWLSVLAAATLFCIEFLCSSHSAGFDSRGVLSLMVLYHAFIGVGEALITGAVLAFVLARRPDLIPTPQPAGPIRTVGGFAATGLVAALAIAAILSPFKSEFPDGLDAVSEQLGFATLETERPPLVLEDYAVPAPEVAWWPGLSVSVAGILGTLVVFAGAIGLAGVTRRHAAPVVVVDGGHGR
ncbi:MAG: energy-coupling factor ABC transporter permease [Planctomycetes bacterium]|nr:energy-coupling factor ABC transporter permease [Planctomycetota bacterium]